MKITVCLPSDVFFTLELSTSTLISELKVLIGAESGISDKDFILSKDGEVIQDHSTSTVGMAGVENNDLIFAMPVDKSENPRENKIPRFTTDSKAPTLDFKSIKVPGTSKSNPVEDARLLLISRSPYQLSLLRERNPELAAVVNDPAAFSRVFEKQQNLARQHQEELTQLMSADPLDPNVQEKIAGLIRQRNIDMEMESALEYYPETFGQVNMLFINCKVKDQPIKAFVDSGAQSTLMSEDCARRCHLDSLIDKRWTGKAYGVGTQTIIGRVHNSLIEVCGIFIPTSFMVLKNQTIDLLIGLDMLKRHQCCIDLKRNVLVIDGRVEAPFLPESEIPILARNPALFDPNEDKLDNQSENSSDDFQLDDNQRHKVELLVSRGLPRSKAIAELINHKWDIDEALASYLRTLIG